MPLAMVDDILTISECGLKSVATNSFINSKIEMKKLTLGKNKCKQIHVGKDNIFCPTLEVHGEPIEVVYNEKYLGDIVANVSRGDGSNSKNISARKSKGLGIVSQIMMMLQSVSLGHFYFEIAILLRDSLLINGIL